MGGIILATLAFGAVKSPKEPEKPLEISPTAALVGAAKVELLAPTGLIRVDGQDPKGDEFIESLKERFKLRVLAVYADPNEYRDFVAGLSKGQGSLIPRLALISVPTRMDKKSYDPKAVIKEKKRYREWFSLAINTRPLAWLFGRKANSKLKDKLGLNVGFEYQTGQETGRFDEKDRSLSFSVLATMSLYGAKSDFIVAASTLNLADKLIFLSWVEPVASVATLPQALAKARSVSLAWLGEVATKNGQPLKPIDDEE